MSIVRMVTRDALKKSKPPAGRPGRGPLEAMAEPATPAAGDDKALTQALEILSEYIPTEVVAIYVFGLSVLATISADPSFKDQPVWAILFFLCLALCVVFTFFAWRPKQLKDAQLSFPVWPMIAALVSFAVWSMAIPGNPVADSPGKSALAGFAALVSSFLLRGVENAFFPDTST